LKPKHLEVLKPFLVARFEGEGDGTKAVVEELA